MIRLQKIFQLALRQNKLAVNFSTLLIGNVLARFASALATILIARSLGPDIYGIFAAALSLARISSVFFTLGLDTWILQRAGRAAPVELSKLSGAIYSIRIGLGPVWLATLWMLTLLIDRSSLPTGPVLLAALSVWLEYLTLTTAFIFQGKLENEKTTFLTLSFHILFLALVGTLLAGGGETITLFLTVRIAAGSISLIIAFWLLLLQVRPLLNRSLIVEGFREARIFAPSLGLALLAKQGDIVIIATILDNTAAGIYAPAIVLLNTVLLLPDALHGVLLPALSQRLSTLSSNLVTGRQDLSRNVVRIALVAVATGFLITIILYLSADLLVDFIYTTAFEETKGVLRLLSIIVPIRMAAAVFGAHVVALFRHGWRLVVQSAAVTLNIGLNIWVLSFTDWGLTGVGVVYILTEIIIAGGYFLISFTFGGRPAVDDGQL